MKVTFLIFLAGLASTSALAQGIRLPWRSIDPTAADALYGFRQSGHWIARMMAVNLDGQRLGLDRPDGEALNFDPARHLRYVVRDLNGDGRPEAFLFFDWPPVRSGPAGSEGVVMVEDDGGWRVACGFRDRGEAASAGAIRLLARQHRGWRSFTTSHGAYSWRPVPGHPRRMECFQSDGLLTWRGASGHTPQAQAQVQGTRLAWQSLDRTAAAALHGLRHSDHWLAEAMAFNMDDDDRQGLSWDGHGMPFNFDAAYHLIYIVRDLNEDGQPEVFLMFEWPNVRGNTTEGEGVVMVRDENVRWRIACSFWDKGGTAPGDGIRLLARGQGGWHGYATSNGHDSWRPLSGNPGRMACQADGNPLPWRGRQVTP